MAKSDGIAQVNIWHRFLAELAAISAVIAANLGLIQGVIAIIAGLLAIAVYIGQLYRMGKGKDPR